MWPFWFVAVLDVILSFNTARRHVVVVCPSVRPSVCPSQAGIVPKTTRRIELALAWTFF